MRPSTIADAVDRIVAGVAQEKAIAEFVDTFDLAPSNEARFEAIADAPRMTDDPQLDALVAAIAEYLSKQRRLGRVPRWAADPRRRLAEPWFTTSNPNAAMREYLTYASPAEFASRNIFTEERPLRRARGPGTDRQ